MSEEQEQMDYEALNAKTALDLNKAQQEIVRLTKAKKRLIQEARKGIQREKILQAKVEQLEGGLNELADTLEAHGNGAFDPTIREIRLLIKEAALGGDDE